jgi:hypothetical protein
MFQSLYNVLSGQYQVLRRSPSPTASPNRSSCCGATSTQALREIKRESRIREVPIPNRGLRQHPHPLGIA